MENNEFVTISISKDELKKYLIYKNKGNKDLHVFSNKMKPLKSIDEIEENSRVFYELGYKINIKKGIEANWVKSGIFKEIKDLNFIKNDPKMKEDYYLLHHNFMIIK